MKNYSRAMTTFALSDMARPYLAPILDKSHQKRDAFILFIKSKKKKANCIKGLRELLLVKENDSEETCCLKKAFREISVIFLKFFSVNWIFHGKIADRIAHLRYRFRILRRVQNPMYFTYLEGFAQ